MRRVVFTFGVLAVFTLTSCKEKATNKIQEANVAVAAERDEAAKKLPVMTFDKTEHDFGAIEQNSPQETIFKFTNTGNAPLIITDAKSTCGCTVPEKPTEPIAPGDTGELKVRFNGSGQNQVTKTVTITANTEKGQELLRIKAFVNPKNAGPTGPVMAQ